MSLLKIQRSGVSFGFQATHATRAVVGTGWGEKNTTQMGFPLPVWFWSRYFSVSASAMDAIKTHTIFTRRRRGGATGNRYVRFCRCSPFLLGDRPIFCTPVSEGSSPLGTNTLADDTAGAGASWCPQRCQLQSLARQLSARDGSGCQSRGTGFGGREQTACCSGSSEEKCSCAASRREQMPRARAGTGEEGAAGGPGLSG